MKALYLNYLRIAFSPQGLGVIASAVLSVLSIFGFIFSPAEGVILAVLCLLTASIMVKNLSEERFHRKLIFLAENHKAATESLVRVDDLPPLANRISDADAIWVSGFTLSTFLVSHRILLRNFISRGGSLRILMAPQDGPIVEESFLYFPMEQSLYENGMRISKDIISEIRNGHEQQVEARVLRVFPSHLLLLINPNRSDAEAQVHLNVYQRSPEDNPVLVVHREESSLLYETFRSEYEALWEENA